MGARQRFLKVAKVTTWLVDGLVLILFLVVSSCHGVLRCSA